MRNTKSNKKPHIFTNLTNTLGLSMVGTAIGVTTHHLWRRYSNPNAQISDYVYGIGRQLQRIENANYQAWQTWWQTYQNMNSYSEHKDAYQSNVPKKHQQNAHKKFSNRNQPVPSVAVTSHWVSGVANKSLGIDFDDFYVVGINNKRQVVWQTKVPERVHDIVVQTITDSDNLFSRHDVAVMGRRPSEYFWIMDCATGNVIHTITAQKNRHFYGHACYSLDGKFLYVAENDTENFNGKIGIYDVLSDYKKIHEFNTYGIGPHEIIIHPDGGKLVIANGGIKTERASREELNLDSMQPSLVYLSLKKGEEGKLLQQIEPKHNQMSIRHISAITHGEYQGTIAIGIQFQGERHLNIPLILTHTFGDDEFVEYHPASDWRQFHHYIASVVVNSQSAIICATSPIGGCVSIFDIHTKSMIDTFKITDCAGIAPADNGFLVSDGQGGLTLLNISNDKISADTQTLPMAFDNHMQRVI